MTIEKARIEIINYVKKAIQMMHFNKIPQLAKYWSFEITDDGMLNFLNVNGHVWESLFSIEIEKMSVYEVHELAWLYYKTIHLFYSVIISK